MAGNISPDALAQAVMDELQKYAGAVTAGVKLAAEETAQECVAQLRQTSPIRRGRGGGRYRKGWKKTKAFESGSAVRYTVHNKTDYQLTHLLEKGHAKRGGGRVAAIVHIAPAEQAAIAMLERKAKEACKP